MDSITANLFVQDIARTVSFYEQLGFSKVVSVPDQAPYNWVMMANGAVSIMFQTFESLGGELPAIQRTPGASLLLYIKMKDLQPFYEKTASFANVLSQPAKTFYGALEFTIADPDGYVLTFAEAGE